MYEEAALKAVAYAMKQLKAVPQLAKVKMGRLFYLR